MSLAAGQFGWPYLASHLRGVRRKAETRTQTDPNFICSGNGFLAEATGCTVGAWRMAPTIHCDPTSSMRGRHGVHACILIWQHMSLFQNHDAITCLSKLRVPLACAIAGPGRRIYMQGIPVRQQTCKIRILPERMRILGARGTCAICQHHRNAYPSAPCHPNPRDLRSSAAASRMHQHASKRQRAVGRAMRNMFHVIPDPPGPLKKHATASRTCSGA